MIPAGTILTNPNLHSRRRRKFTGRFQSFGKPLGAIPSIGAWRDSQRTPSSFQGPSTAERRASRLSICRERRTRPQGRPPIERPEPDGWARRSLIPSSAGADAAMVHRSSPRGGCLVVRPSSRLRRKPTEGRTAITSTDVTVQVSGRHPDRHSGHCHHGQTNVNDKCYR